MLSKEQHDLLVPSRMLLKHIYDGGSAHHLPMDLYLRIWNELGKFPVDTNCNACKIEMAKELFTEILLYEKENGIEIAT